MQPISSNLDTLKNNVVNAHGKLGEIWFAKLDDTVKKLSEYWGLSDITPVANMSWNYVAIANKEQEKVVLKLSCDIKALDLEYEALQHFSGSGTIKVLAYAPLYQAMLLECALPGTSLKAYHTQTLDEVIVIYAAVAKKLQTKFNPKQIYPHVKDWCQVIDSINDTPVAPEYIKKAKTLRAKLLTTMCDEYLCHGDLHFENIIKDTNKWLAIDPKGVIAEIAFEAAAFDLISAEETKLPLNSSILNERITMLARALNIDKQRLTDWIFLKIMIAIQWFIEDQGDPTKMILAAQAIYPLC